MAGETVVQTVSQPLPVLQQCGAQTGACAPRTAAVDYSRPKLPCLRNVTTCAATKSLYMIVVCGASTVTKSVMAVVFASSTDTVPSCGPDSARAL